MGNEIGFPPTNYLIAGEKVNQGKEIHLARHLPINEKSFLQYTSYQNVATKETWDVVSRPNEVVDIIPYFKTNNGFSILAKHSYPRALSTIAHNSPIIDNKWYSGYITEGISISKSDKLRLILEERFGIHGKEVSSVKNALGYYTSPGGIDERVSSTFVELNESFASQIHSEAFGSENKEKGSIYVYDAVQLLNTAQTGALVEARLEMNIYNLLFKEQFPLPLWLGEKLQMKSVESLQPIAFKTLIPDKAKDYVQTMDSVGFLTRRRALFTQIGVDKSTSILEYVYPSKVSCNTLLTLPVVTFLNEVYVGVELRSLPVPQLYSDNSMIITAPANRLPFDVSDVLGLEKFISQHEVMGSKIEAYAKLGEKYFPSVGITPEQVYPFVVSIDFPSEDLYWLSLKDLLQNIEKIEDAHLLISICRLTHMLAHLK